MNLLSFFLHCSPVVDNIHVVFNNFFPLVNYKTGTCLTLLLSKRFCFCYYYFDNFLLHVHVHVNVGSI